ncbi:Protein CBR-SSL-1 [Caenorhabditis briggsae]|uniref:Protein CBR-SSL-1 n=1 Tax=Caenorhabditis briggsae TaxID=6238 RepID=A8WMT2_CAEBR|nr:Protein CBR-SSL-1 [Caenorhabditis briggsae]CAP21787.2 Protein CBR-SSL-1 [Caenorhabditis briggsae]
MPAPPTTPRTPSTRISRRTSSRSVATDEPSTSAAAPEEPTSSSTVAPEVAMDVDEPAPPPPSTSSEDVTTAVEEPEVAEEPSKTTNPVDQRIAYMCALLLADNRGIQDKLLTSCGPAVPREEPVVTANTRRIKPVVDHLHQVEEKAKLTQKSEKNAILEPKMRHLGSNTQLQHQFLSQNCPKSISKPQIFQIPRSSHRGDSEGSKVCGACRSSASTRSSATGGDRGIQPSHASNRARRYTRAEHFCYAIGERSTRGKPRGESSETSEFEKEGASKIMSSALKIEAHVLARIAELRKTGMWTSARLPKCMEPERNKTHWDYLLEEAKWMATDFRTETNTKKKMARILAHACAKHYREKQVEVARAAERELKEKKRMCAGIAKMVREFWTGVDKLVDFRAQEVRTARLRKAKNKHLMFVLGQVDGISSIVQDGLTSSKSPSIASDDKDDKEFDAGSDSEEDDEQTIEKAEKGMKKDDVKKEIDALQDEAGEDMDDFLINLPTEYLASYGITAEDVEEMKRAKKEREERAKEAAEAKEGEAKEEEKKDDEPSTSQKRVSSESDFVRIRLKNKRYFESKNRRKKLIFTPNAEQSQDTSAEDGNGDGRGVLKNVDYTKLNSNDSDERQQELANIAEEALKFQPKGYTLETTQVKTPVPFLVRGTLREYQMVGLDWMVTLYEKNLNGILADEMGLGKTIQTISLLAHLACSESIWGPHLIVVPTSVILNWEMEFKKWCPALKILTYFGTAKERAEKRKGWMKPNCFHVCITSYKTVTQDIRSFKQRAWQYLILDEAQNIKNWKSQRWQALLNVRARRRLLLTGTPLQNSLMELWSLMHFLMPTIFSSHDDFKDWFSNPLTGMMEGSMEFNAPLIGRLHKVLRPFILRRLKKEVEKQLPEKTEHVIKCSLSKRQRYLYDDFMSRRSTKDNLKSGNMMSVLNIVMQLRKCCNHPNLFEPRPVLAPFVVPKLQMDLPAFLFDIAHQDPSTPEVPEIFYLNRAGYQAQSNLCPFNRKPLIEELEGMKRNVEKPIPIVDGFRFNRTTFVTKNPHHQGEESEDEGVRHSNGINGNAPSTSSARPQTNSVIRSKTVLHPTTLAIATDRSGFHYDMANQGRSRLDETGRLSPPLKRQKLTGTQMDWSSLVPADVLERMEESRRAQLQIVARRFGGLRAPIIPLEVVALIREEIEFPRLATEENESVQEELMDFVELLVQRFGMYVEPVLTDAWQCRPSSSGLPSYIRNNFSEIESSSRTLLLKSSSSLDTRMAISRSLQFPELRLIEYDCGKLQTLALLLRQLYLYKHRCLIFTQMSKMLDVLQTFLSHHGYQYFRLDGTTGVEQRQAMMERFNADSKVFCFILSTRSGGVGVNLTGADTVIFYDSDWNPTMDAQAQDRCHRIGQTRNVSIYRLISERTIEENILKKATQKRRLGELAIDEAGFTPEFFKQADSIRDLFDGENVDVTAPEDVPLNEKDMEKVMARCEDEADVNAAKNAAAEATVDTAEFDERTMPGAAGATLAEEEADEKYMELIKSLRPIERYAVNLLETAYKPEFEEECKEAEAQIHQKREEWDKNLNDLNTASEQADEMADDVDFYPNAATEEVRKKKATAAAAKKAQKFVVRARSPSKRKSLAPSFDPYISYASHALGSPPDSPVKKNVVISSSSRRSSSTVGGTVGGRGRPRKFVKKGEQSEPEEDSDEDYEEVKPRPVKRKRTEPIREEPKKEAEPKKRLALPEQGPLTLPAAPAPSPAPKPPSKPAHIATPRPVAAPGPRIYQPPANLMPVRVIRASGPPGAGPSAPSRLPIPQGTAAFRRPMTTGIRPAIGAGIGPGRLPLRPQTRIPGIQPPRQFVVPTGPAGAVTSNIQRIRMVPVASGAPGAPRAATGAPRAASGPPNKMMFPVRVVQRPATTAMTSPRIAVPLERPGFGIYEKPRFSLGSRRARGASEAFSPGASTSSLSPRPPQPQPPPPAPPGA